METLSKSCEICGKTFHKNQNVSLRDWKEQSKFCSRTCYWKSKLKPITLECETCGIKFAPKFWNKRARFCSRQCRNISLRKPVPNCDVCGKPVKKTGRRFCSPGCKVTWYRAENVYNYLGEDSREFPHDLTFLAFWEKRASLIRDRDKVCRHCGKTPKVNGRALDVHHIIPYRISKDNSPENLVALCRSCHKRADHLARNGNGH